jgi:hypothetical protein
MSIIHPPLPLPLVIYHYHMIGIWYLVFGIGIVQYGEHVNSNDLKLYCNSTKYRPIEAE